MGKTKTTGGRRKSSAPKKTGRKRVASTRTATSAKSTSRVDKSRKPSAASAKAAAAKSKAAEVKERSAQSGNGKPAEKNLNQKIDDIVKNGGKSADSSAGARSAGAPKSIKVSAAQVKADVDKQRAAAAKTSRSRGSGKAREPKVEASKENLVKLIRQAGNLVKGDIARLDDAELVIAAQKCARVYRMANELRSAGTIKKTA